ncbi:flagellar protein FlgJ [Photobacterium aphoticum]|uniref:Flagellar protein FlgJ n=1 Tax=Photobacterium aphoticum TaxID=754436 RepID=A0A090QYD5_9GAMM|nr:flagellar protein FlgJ [Photobacterium aphoticum]
MFDSPRDFVARLTPFAEKAAKALGTDPAVLIAQAALETGWGKKVIKNAAGSSHNLFNIKADPRWNGGKVATNTLEFHQGSRCRKKPLSVRMPTIRTALTIMSVS